MGGERESDNERKCDYEDESKWEDDNEGSQSIGEIRREMENNNERRKGEIENNDERMVESEREDNHERETERERESNKGVEEEREDSYEGKIGREGDADNEDKVEGIKGNKEGNKTENEVLVRMQWSGSSLKDICRNDKKITCQIIIPLTLEEKLSHRGSEESGQAYRGRINFSEADDPGGS